MAEIIMVFDGEKVHKETKGFVGNDCVTKTKFLDKKPSSYPAIQQLKSVIYVQNLMYLMTLICLKLTL